VPSSLNSNSLPLANEISGRITSADPAAVSVEGLENVTCLSIDAPATYSTFA